MSTAIAQMHCVRRCESHLAELSLVCPVSAANDVANAFGTSVGSKTLKLWSAVLIASIFEFLGAMLLGGQVTKTIAGGIAKSSTFNSNPYVFMFGK